MRGYNCKYLYILTQLSLIANMSKKSGFLKDLVLGPGMLWNAVTEGERSFSICMNKLNHINNG